MIKKKPLEGKKTKRGLWDNESAGRGGEKAFPARSARSKRERQNRLQGLRGAVSPKIIKTWRFDAICQIKLKMSVFLQINSKDTEGNFQGQEGILKLEVDYRRPSSCCEGKTNWCL